MHSDSLRAGITAVTAGHGTAMPAMFVVSRALACQYALRGEESIKQRSLVALEKALALGPKDGESRARLDRLGDLVNPAELGTLVKIQGEFMQEQARLMADEAKVVQNLGDRINQIGRSGGQKG